MDYYATYSMGDLFSADHGIPVGTPLTEEPSSFDTLFYGVKLFQDSYLREHIGDLRVRRVQISKIVNEGRSVFEAMDQIDQLEHEIYLAVWNEDEGTYKDDFEAFCGDLVIFEELRLKEGVVLHGFDINKILDDMTYHVGGDSGLLVYLQSYADFTHFNLDRCCPLEGIGFAKATTIAGLAIERLAMNPDDEDTPIDA